MHTRKKVVRGRPRLYDEQFAQARTREASGCHKSNLPIGLFTDFGDKGLSNGGRQVNVFRNEALTAVPLGSRPC